MAGTERREHRQKICGLLVTHRCNFRCRYCYVTDYSGGDMDLEVAKRAITGAFAWAADADLLEIDFMGGEPLTAFDLIRRAAEWTWAQDWGTDFFFFATTNGSLLDPEKKTWFSANRRRFVLCLSYDGARTGQAENRDRRLPDLDYFLETWPEQALQMTVTAASAACLRENVTALAERGGLSMVNCALGQEPWPEEAFLRYEGQLWELIQYYLAHPEKPPVNVITRNLPAAAQSVLDFQSGGAGPVPPQCGMGRDFYVVEADGGKYPCHLLSPLALGQRALENLNAWDLWNREDFSVPNCGGCPLNRACPACCGMAYGKRGTPFWREYNRCRTFRAELLASCKFQAGRLLAGADSEEDRRNAQAIQVLLASGVPLRGRGPWRDAAPK